MGNERGRDIGWMWFGGSTEHKVGTQGLKKERKGTKLIQNLREDLKWETVDSELPAALHGNCAVQINDGEVAIIGGYEGPDPSDKFYIYNFKTNTWRERPAPVDTLGDPVDLYGVSCAKVIEKTTDEIKVLFGMNSNTDLKSNLWEWEMSSDRITLVWQKKTDEISAGIFKRVDENTVLGVHGRNVARFSASSDNYLEIFNQFGNTDSLATFFDFPYTDFFILPRKETKCLPPPADGGNGGGNGGVDGGGGGQTIDD